MCMNFLIRKKFNPTISLPPAAWPAISHSRRKMEGKERKEGKGRKERDEGSMHKFLFAGCLEIFRSQDNPKCKEAAA